MNKIGILGFGNMGEALAAGIVKNLPQTELLVTEARLEAAEKAKAQYGASLYGDMKEMAAASELLILAIKPQDLPSVLDDLAPHVAGKGVISVAAGVKLDFLQKHMPRTQISRFMPNLAAKVGASPVAVAFPKGTDQGFKESALSIAGAVGSAYEMKEELISAFIGISGSGIAYLFDVVHAMALGGTREGIPYAQSLGIVLDTMAGAAKVLQQTGENPAAMVSKVTSPAGTTIEGVKALAEGKLQDTLMEAVHKAAQRSRDLEG